MAPSPPALSLCVSPVLLTRISKKTKILFSKFQILSIMNFLFKSSTCANAPTFMNSMNQIASYQPSAIGRTVRRAPSVRPSLRRDPSPPMVCRPPKRRLRRTALREASPGCRSDGRGRSHLLSPSVRRWAIYPCMRGKSLSLPFGSSGGLGGRW